MLESIIWLVLGIILLLGGGELLVREAITISLRLKISILVVGSTVVAFATSAPELVVSIYAALDGTPDISIGNVVGSNICNLGLVLGVTALLKPVVIRKTTVKFDWPMMIAASGLLILFSWNQLISWWEGALFVIGLVSYSYYLIAKSRRDTLAHAEDITEAEEEVKKKKPLALNLFLLVLAIVGLYFGSKWFVGGATAIARYFDVSERIIALTLVALGTSLPELMTSMVAIYRKESDIAVGNLIGSNIFNILSILGITSIITEIRVGEKFLTVDYWWMLGIALVLLPLMLRNDRVSRFGGGLLVVFYTAYLIFIT